jgi:hypothetical protein
MECHDVSRRSLSAPDPSLDVVIGLIGSMLAPRPELVASEMIRMFSERGGHTASALARTCFR